MVISSYNLQEGQAVPYVTIDEVKFSPTASTIDFSNLIENGSQALQDRALQELINVASVEADNYCFGPLGTLCATLNTENGRYRANRMGQFIIHPTYWPILEVRKFSVGYGPGAGMNDIPLTDDNTSIERFQFLVTQSASVGLQVGPLSIVGGNYQSGSEMFCEWKYVNGWANTFMTADVVPGASAINVQSPLGIYPNQTIQIWDGMNNESVKVASSYDGTSSTIPLTDPLIFRHSSGVNVSTLPATVKQAVIHLVVAMIKQRGQGGLVLNEIGEPVAVSGSTVTSTQDKAMAYDLLDTYQQIWGRH
jgi:hypothetical protein